MLGAVEAHVFEEVGQTPLILGLVDRTDTLGEEKVGGSRRVVVVADIVSQAVRKVADTDVGRDYLGLDGCGCECQQGREQFTEYGYSHYQKIMLIAVSMRLPLCEGVCDEWR